MSDARTMNTTSYISRFSLFGNNTWTRSNGSTASRIYERLTKASRRRDPGPGKLLGPREEVYRRGVYDAIKAMQDELNG